ncbi:MAG: uroporphyrinogen decarboxylase family protein [Verrucomicrobiae bacterium]|nr:uroporphyrinogen decarboxylase family protein [Verrucomicrobiae bacterium]MCX7722144.1 uroporphyrinogen decarboxylase family protein [Verrucomicrobiae bacterium]
MDSFQHFVLTANKRVAMPLAVYPGVRLTSRRVRDVVTDAKAQVEVISALHQRYSTPVVFTAMDLSVEAEAFGCPVTFADDEVPTVAGPAVTDLARVHELRVPEPGEKRMRVYLEAAALLRDLPDAKFVFGGCIGPFTLAARLVGLSEACQLTVTEPELLHRLLEKTTAFLGAYVRAFEQAGANGVIMAEPSAGLLSPAAFGTFSSAYVRKIAESLERGKFVLIFHCCSARVVHLASILETGAEVFHFGAPMDIVQALTKVPGSVVLCGNLDPASVFVQGTPAEVEAKVKQLLEATRAWRNFVISSGCDVPAATPLANLDAFYRAVGLAGMG